LDPSINPLDGSGFIFFFLSSFSCIYTLTVLNTGWIYK